MKTYIVQLNHPGVEKPYKPNHGYFSKNGLVIRDWNNESSHYRKFILSEGKYLKKIKSQPINGKILIWGEWEAYSKYTHISNKSTPYGIHKPFHSNINKGCQNTDPYVFGDNFKYAICSQTGVMVDLDKGSLILFGTTTKNGFMLDTVFVVKQHEKAESIFNNKAQNFTKTYKEVTLEQLSKIYLSNNSKTSKNRVYLSQTWIDNKDFFSFVPCKPESEDNLKGFQKLCIPTQSISNQKTGNILMSNQKVGHPYNHLINYNPYDIWKYIVDFALEAGFCLGIFIDEPCNDDSFAFEGKRPNVKKSICNKPKVKRKKGY